MATNDWERFRGNHDSSYGSSRDFDRDIAKDRRDLVVPEDEITMVEGGIGWCREDEEPPAPGEPCTKCRGKIRPGSHLWCPKCQASGFDGPLAAQLRLARMPSLDPKPTDIDGLSGGRH